MLLFPLSPFFVLFCNVVATSDHQDFEMIKKITDDLRQFAKANASIGKLYGLFSKFLDLCAPLIKADAVSGLYESELALPAESRLGRKMLGHQPGPYTDLLGRTADQILNTLSGGTSASKTASDIPDSGEAQSDQGWDDGLMWELFGNQPSLGWTESELWDAMAHLDTV
jgi:hypothetical protein